MTKRLNQVIASEAAVKAAVTKQITEIHKLNQKPELFEGLQKQYTPLDEVNGERLPPEEKRVQLRADEQIDKAIALWREQMDLTYTKDTANTVATADVVVNGTPLLKAVPVTFLLFLEKRLQDMAAVVTALPVLDEAYDWNWSQGLYRTQPVQTHRTKKTQRPIVMYEATKEHPAQTQLITEDVIVGNYATVRTSGALSHMRKRELIRRITQLQLAVKDAREQANLVEVQQGLSTQAVLDFVFSTQ